MIIAFKSDLLSSQDANRLDRSPSLPELAADWRPEASCLFSISLSLVAGETQNHIFQ
jgi:hypothetical protein